MIEYKSSKAILMGIDGRSVTGIFAVHGNVDSGDGWSYRDRSHPGLFGDFTVNGRKRAVYLWQHDSNLPPIATIDSTFEVSQADLPPAVKLYAPDATGGVAVKRTYFDDDFSDRVFKPIASGALSEMSYAYDITRYDIEKPEEGSRDIPIRNLYAADLYDISDVNWGMNPATSADGSKGLALSAHADAVKAALSAYTTRLHELNDRRAKEGRVLSSANYAALKSLADDLEGSIQALRDILSQAEPKQTTDVRRLMLESQRALAYVNGIAR